MTATLHYVHDPMCSWCWAYRPVWTELQAALPPGIAVRSWLGGLAPDSNDPMPAALQQTIQGHWRTIEQRVGTRFNYEFWTQCQPRRSTYIACRAVIAARHQGREEAMTLAIQRAYYLQARNPSDSETLLQLADELQLDSRAFADDLEAEQTHQTLHEEIQFSRRLPIRGFPSLVLERDGQWAPVPLDYHDARSTLLLVSTGAKG